MGLFFIFGGITSLNDVIIPKLKELFTLSFFEALLVQTCFFIAYAIVGIPGARLEVIPGWGHDLPEALWDRLAAEVAAIARRS